MSDQTPNAFESNQQQETPASQPETSTAFVDSSLQEQLHEEHFQRLRTRVVKKMFL